MPTLHVVIPFYNEPATLEPCLRRAVGAPLPEGWTAEIVMVDDHSLDAASRAAIDLVRRLREEGASVDLLRHDRNRGKGAAIRTGFESVLRRADDDDAVVIQDADLEYDPHDFERLLSPVCAGEADAVFGTRWGAHRPVSGLKARLHRLGNRSLTVASNCCTGLRVSDMECCYKVFSVPVLRRAVPELTEDRFGVEPQIAAVLARQGWRVAEVPVRYDPRGFADGKKIGLKDAIDALQVILRERSRTRSGKRG